MTTKGMWYIPPAGRIAVLAVGLCLASMGHAQGEASAADSLPSVESEIAMRNTQFAMDTAQIAETMRSLLARKKLSYQDLPTVEYNRDYGLWLGPYIEPAAPAMSYTEKIALLEEALRIAKELEAEEVRSHEQSSKP